MAMQLPDLRRQLTREEAEEGDVSAAENPFPSLHDEEDHDTQTAWLINHCAELHDRVAALERLAVQLAQLMERNR